MADQEPGASENPPPYIPTAPPASEPPPPYTPPPPSQGIPTAPPASEQPPPYSPPSQDITSKTAELQTGGTPPYGNYGTDGPKSMEQYPPGAPPGFDPNMTPMSTSTTLLISRERKPPTFLLLSIMTALCFSPVFGIMAIIFSCMSDSAWHAGDYDTAKRYSQVALSLSIVGVAISLFILIIIFVTGTVRVY